jgi:prepilin-type N-terminal cleavage/methylation domain-containing protein
MLPGAVRRRRSPLRRRRGFTLIEIIAVVAIIAMVFALGIPQLGGRSWDALGDEAENIAESLRFARQRAIMTGVPHRVLIDLEEGGYLIEWYVSQGQALSAVGEEGGDGGGAGLMGLAGGAFGEDEEVVLDLHPPPESERDYHPIPHRELGSFRWLDDALYFVGVEGAAGWVESGDYGIVFYEDGTTDPALVELANAQDEHLTLEIEAVLDRVRVRKGGARS